MPCFDGLRKGEHERTCATSLKLLTAVAVLAFLTVGHTLTFETFRVRDRTESMMRSVLQTNRTILWTVVADPTIDMASSRVNGIVKATTDYDTTVHYIYQFANATVDNPWLGDFMEMRVYNHPSQNQELTVLEDALMRKWTITN